MSVYSTLLDVAKRAGVAKSTASMAMRGDVRISLATRQRIELAARELNYRPDPMLSALSMRRHDKGPHRGLANLACLLDDRWDYDLSRYSARKHVWLDTVAVGMWLACEQMGYALTPFRVRRDLILRKNPDRLFASLGIRGIILLPFQQENLTLPLDRRCYSMISIGGYHGVYSTHNVVPDSFAAMDMTCRKLHEAGYRRIGLVHSLHYEQRQRYRWMGSYEKERSLKRPGMCLLPPWLPERLTEKTLHSWIAKQRPEVVITNDALLYQAILSKGIRVPEDLSVVFLDRDHCGVPDAAGISQHLDIAGKLAVEQLHLLLLRGERGETDRPLETLIHPSWVDGATMRKRKP